MEILQVKVVPEIKGGSSIANTIVKCNITQYFDQSSAGSQVVTGLSQDSLTLEKTNALAPTVESDDERNIGRTDSTGEANFYLKVIKGRHDL